MCAAAAKQPPVPVTQGGSQPAVLRDEEVRHCLALAARAEGDGPWLLRVRQLRCETASHLGTEIY